MTNLKPAHNGCFMVNDAAAADPAVQMAMASYMKRLETERQQREWFAKWEEKRPQGTFGNWHISDRD